MTTTKQAEMLDAIVAQLDREVWSPDTLDAIAEILREGGFEVRGPDEED